MGENGGHIAKTGGLDYTFAGAKRSAMIYLGNTVTHVLCEVVIYFISPLSSFCRSQSSISVYYNKNSRVPNRS